MPTTSRAITALVALVALAPACSFPEEHYHQTDCVDGQLLGSVCPSTMPDGEITLTGSIDTAIVGPGGCTEIAQRSANRSLCIIFGTSIRIPAGARVRATARPAAGATNTNPLVLLATDSIVIDGTLEVASHAGETVLGAGARTTAGCDVDGRGDGRHGWSISTSPPSAAGGAGGAGGSFGAIGGNGGVGGNVDYFTAAGNARMPESLDGLVGGCPGGRGGDGYTYQGTGGLGGAGGGAVYLLASHSITVAGKINASGAGGAAGMPAVLDIFGSSGGGSDGVSLVATGSSSGGGGGGSGGLIVLEADLISVSGSVFANGGGGGGGFGGIPTGGIALPGADPLAPNATAAGGAANNGGGSGGGGGACGMSAAAGADGQDFQPNVTPESAGGGGGGGLGMIMMTSSAGPTSPCL